MECMENHDKLRESLVGAVIKTFEEMAFIEVVDDHNADIDTYYESILSIDIIEPTSAHIIIYMPETLIKNISENIFGDEYDNLKENTITDCIEELLNVIGGNFLRNCYGKDLVYKLEFPEVLIDPNESKYKNIVEAYLNAEEIYFKIKYLW